MKLIAGLLIAMALAIASGCARTDWIDRTLVTVDVTGVWLGSMGGIQGSTGEFQFELEQQGSTVKGLMRVNTRGLGGQGAYTRPIDGTVAGDVFRFRDSRGIVEGQLTVSGDEMNGRVSLVIGASLSLRRVDPSSRPASPPR
jgi:hypothetical protein